MVESARVDSGSYLESQIYEIHRGGGGMDDDYQNI